MFGLVVAAVLGGAIALGGAAALGKLGSETTYRPVVAASTRSEVPAAFANSKALSIHQIFQRWAPGVVQITSTSVVNVPQDPLNNFFGNSFAPQLTSLNQPTAWARAKLRVAVSENAVHSSVMCGPAISSWPASSPPSLPASS